MLFPAPGSRIEDCSPGDPPRRTGGGDGAVCGASAILSGGEGERCALSSAYFELPGDIVWLPVWRVERGARRKLSSSEAGKTLWPGIRPERARPMELTILAESVSRTVRNWLTGRSVPARRRTSSA